MSVDERVQDVLNDATNDEGARHRHAQQRVEQRRREGVAEQHSLVLGGDTQQSLH